MIAAAIALAGVTFFPNPARGGLSPARAGYDAALKIEAQLRRVTSKVVADLLPPSESPAGVRANVHQLRLRHDCHGGLLCHAGESQQLERTIVRPGACELGREAVHKGRPVRALLRISVDSLADAKPQGAA